MSFGRPDHLVKSFARSEARALLIVAGFPYVLDFRDPWAMIGNQSYSTRDGLHGQKLGSAKILTKAFRTARE